MKVICYIDDLKDMVLAMRTAKNANESDLGVSVFENGEEYYWRVNKGGTIVIRKKGCG